MLHLNENLKQISHWLVVNLEYRTDKSLKYLHMYFELNKTQQIKINFIEIAQIEKSMNIFQQIWILHKALTSTIY